MTATDRRWRGSRARERQPPLRREPQGDSPCRPPACPAAQARAFPLPSRRPRWCRRARLRNSAARAAPGAPVAGRIEAPPARRRSRRAPRSRSPDRRGPAPNRGRRKIRSSRPDGAASRRRRRESLRRLRRPGRPSRCPRTAPVPGCRGVKGRRRAPRCATLHPGRPEAGPVRTPAIRPTQTSGAARAFPRRPCTPSCQWRGPIPERRHRARNPPPCGGTSCSSARSGTGGRPGCR